MCVRACVHLGPYILAGGLGISSGRRSVPEAVVCGRTGTEPKCAQGERALEARTQRPGHIFSQFLDLQTCEFPWYPRTNPEI